MISGPWTHHPSLQSCHIVDLGVFDVNVHKGVEDDTRQRRKEFVDWQDRAEKC